MRGRTLGLLALVALVASFSPVVTAATTLTVAVSEVSQDSALVTWSRTGDWCFASYEVQYREVGASGWTPAASITDPSTLSYRVTGLQASRTYEARVIDTDCLGSQPTNTTQFTTKAVLFLGLTDSGLMMLIIVAAGVAGASGFFLLRRHAKRRRLESATVLIPIDPTEKDVATCPSCRKLVATEFCPSCGAKNPKKGG